MAKQTSSQLHWDWNKDGKLLLLLFLVAIDWVMRESTRDQERVIKWRPADKLDYLTYAEDLITSIHQHIQ
jgi:hypothetical protein